MAATSRQRVKGRKSNGSFCALPHSIFRARSDGGPPVAVLSARARALLVDLAMQYNGKNNGNLSAAPAVMASYGWTSQGTLADTIAELVAHGFLLQTRQGGRNQCSLFALTWVGIDDGPHDAQPDPVPSRLWEEGRTDMRDATFRRRWQNIRERRRGRS
ncbi:hypothetical protein [Thiohalocapsa marina]|uniref:hypothetical protein n=1 Tax=Thiohalocapsa marina TaxID=424902 RepID=UPI0036DB4AEB